MFILAPKFVPMKGHFCERDSSGTTEAHEMREGDEADSPTRAHKKSSYKVGAFFVRRSGSPKSN
jgi:hypothetical protein